MRRLSHPTPHSIAAIAVAKCFADFMGGFHKVGAELGTGCSARLPHDHELFFRTNFWLRRPSTARIGEGTHNPAPHIRQPRGVIS